MELQSQILKDELNSYLSEIEAFTPDTGQDVQALHDYLIRLTNIIARSNKLMADFQKLNRETKKKAYLKLIGSAYANNANFTKTNAKDYVDACCSESGYLFDLAERTSRAAYHTIEAVRTIVSSLKNERQYSYIQ